MLPRLLPIAALIGAASLASADNYAVIVVGSNTYMNYRHHADACHAYQILKAGGVPADNIVTMMYDDVASDKENPFKGKLFNKPTKKGDAGVDVYDGCAIDYTKKAVTAKLFLSVLEGDAKAVQQELAAQGADGTGKVLNSGPNDNVFVNFVDHGGSGIIEMPNGPLLKKKDLVASLQKMHDNKRYKKLVFYMEACNSGSMFKNLPTDINVFATTAANPNEPSWGTYCPPQDKVNGKDMNTCLGDLYSVNWMEDADKKTKGETLKQQFKTVQTETKSKSHVMQYGTSDFSTDPITDYLGAKAANATTAGKPSDSDARKAAPATDMSTVDSRDIPLVIKFYKYLRSAGADRASRTALARDLNNEIEHRETMDRKFAAVQQRVIASAPPVAATAADDGDEDDACYDEVLDLARDRCVGQPKWTDYSLKHGSTMSELCVRYGAAPVLDALKALC